MDPARRLQGLTLGLCIVLSVLDTVTQSNSAPGTSESCSNHLSHVPNTQCVNSTHSTCQDGYRPSGNPIFSDPTANCDDINECLGPSRADCGANGHCANTPGSYYCSCIDGYESRSGKATFRNASENSCHDIDECLGPSRADCGPHAHCTNTPGNYNCSCIVGYKSSSGKATFRNASESTCHDTDECLGPSRADCGPHAHCINTPGSYNCSCIDGYESSPGKVKFRGASENTCRDIDECLWPSRADCGPHAHCTNTPGSYNCSCIVGYESSSGKATFRSASENSCRDINECQGPSRADCGAHAHCTNTPGSYNCSCIDGYESSPGKATFRSASENSCRDIDECQRNATICEPHGSCINRQGDYMCTCNSGFGKSQTNQLKICKDIDECKSNNSNNCSPKAECINTEGSYRCECRPGYSRLSNPALCEELTCPAPRDGSSIEAQVGRLCEEEREKLKQMKAPDTASRKAALQEFLNTVEELLTGVGPQNGSMEHRHHMVTQAMATVEELLRTLTLALPDGMTGITATHGTELGLVIKRAGFQSQEAVTLLQNKTQMELNWAVAPGQKIEGVTLTGLVTYQGLSSVLEGAARVEGPEWNEISQAGKQKWDQEPGQASYRVLSPVVSAFTNAPHTQAFSPSISFRFSHPEPESKDERRLLCAYWEPNTTRWSTRGCTRLESNPTSTRCQCTHLSSFAVLMAFYELEVQDWTLDLITKAGFPLFLLSNIGLALSLLCLFLAILTFLLCRSIRNVNTSIHLQLCLCLLLADLLFLTAVDSTSHKLGCAIIAGLLHYLFLASFAWMFLEALVLFLTVRNLSVVNYFSTRSPKTWPLSIFGYGFPALVVAVSAAVMPEGYGRQANCWLSMERGFIWSFLGPVCAIIGINSILFALTLWMLQRKLSSLNADVSTLKDTRLLTFKAITQVFILGCTWIFGLFQFGPAATVMAYLFTIVNSLQGAFIFLVHCLLNRQVREEYKRWFACKRKFYVSEVSMSTVATSSRAG